MVSFKKNRRKRFIMVEKKEMFDTAVVKLDFLGKEDDIYNKAIDELDKKLVKDNDQQVSKVIADKVRGSKE